MDEAEVRRAMLYGICLTCKAARDVRVTELAGGATMMELYCPACGKPD